MIIGVVMTTLSTRAALTAGTVGGGRVRSEEAWGVAVADCRRAAVTTSAAVVVVGVVVVALDRPVPAGASVKARGSSLVAEGEEENEEEGEDEVEAGSPGPLALPQPHSLPPEITPPQSPPLSRARSPRGSLHHSRTRFVLYSVCCSGRERSFLRASGRRRRRSCTTSRRDRNSTR